MAFAPPSRAGGGGGTSSSGPRRPAPRGASPGEAPVPKGLAMTLSRGALHPGAPPRPGGRSTAAPSPRLHGGSIGGVGVSAASAAALAELGHDNIIQLSQRCAEDLDQKAKEKASLTQLLSDLKKQKLQYDAKISKKKREVDTTIVQTKEMEKRLQGLQSNNKTVGAEVAGLRAENEKMGAEVEQLRVELSQASDTFDAEVAELEKLRQLLFTYRKEVGAEAKQRDTVQQDLRATRTAQTLMINRLDDMEKRRGALKTCVADTFKLT